MNEHSGTRTRTRLAPGARRTSILDAATRLILRAGPGELAMEDVAREASVARGTLYLYFDSIGGIVAAARERYTRALISEVEPLLAPGGSGSRLRRLDAFIAALAAALGQRRDLHHALFAAGAAAEAPLNDAFSALLSRFIADGRDAGEFAVPDIGLTTSFLVAGLHAVLTDGLHEPGAAVAAVAAAQRLARRTLASEAGDRDRRLRSATRSPGQ